MTFRRKIVHLLDRTGGRKILGWLGSRLYRKNAHSDVSIFWDGSWFSRDGTEYLSDSLKFIYYAQGLQNKKHDDAKRIASAKDHWFHMYKPKEGDTIVDIGAGSGFEALLFSRSVGCTGLVLSIEAHPITYQRLQKTCQYNKINNVIYKNLAIMNSKRLLSISNVEDDEANSVSDVINSSDLSVMGITLDELCEEQKIKKINYLKMNIEGAEQWAIQGMIKTIKNVDFVTIACHDFIAKYPNDPNYCTREKVRTFLLDNGFNVIDRANDERIYIRDHLHGWRAKTEVIDE